MEKKRKLFFILAILFLALVFGFSIYYSSVHLNLTGYAVFSAQPNQTDGNDTYIREDFPNNPFGASTELQIGKTAGGEELKSLIQFNISSVPQDHTIVNANISIYISSIGGNGVNTTIHRITSAWAEAEATWNNKTTSSGWTSAGGDYASLLDSENLTSSQWYTFSITEAVRGWVNSTYNNYGLMLVASNPSSGDYIKFYSSDYTTDESKRPKIEIEHTSNAPPSIDALTTDTNSTNLKEIGEDVTFTLNWTDLEGNNAKAFICNTSDINISGCGNKTFCSTSLASTNPITCTYTVTSAENRTTSFWAGVCDTYNCSTSSENYFYMNHLPVISIIQPNGGETFNQSTGNDTIKFNVSDADSDLLTGYLYYGESQNSTEKTIALNLNLTYYCTDADSDTSTENNCSYSWNTLGLYGTNYYITAIVNDSRKVTNDSSASSFSIYSIIDVTNPNITAQWTESYIYSGKQTQIYANISDENMDSAWIEFNYTTPNITMSNTTATEYNATFTAPAVGAYKFKVYAQDKVANLNDSASWVEFNVTKPNATSQNQTAPSTALPYHAIKVQGDLNATDALRDVHAYLNVPAGFTFFTDYPQTTLIGNFTTNQTKNATWFLSAPLTESTYSLNITYTDNYGNEWNSSNMQVQVTSAVGGGYDLHIAGYPEVETGDSYYVEAEFTQAGTYTNVDSAYISVYDASGSLTWGPAAMGNPLTGKYNYTNTVGASATEGQWETIVNATKSSTSYYANEFFKVVGGPFDVRSIEIISSDISSLNISVSQKIPEAQIKTSQ